MGRGDQTGAGAGGDDGVATRDGASRGRATGDGVGEGAGGLASLATERSRVGRTGVVATSRSQRGRGLVDLIYLYGDGIHAAVVVRVIPSGHQHRAGASGRVGQNVCAHRATG